MRELVAGLLLFFATNVQAFHARPVANLRFDGRIPGDGGGIVGSNVANIPTKAASDGTNFLLLLSNGHVYAQSVDATHARGPQRLIGRGTVVDLIWTGDHYLAAWDDAGKLRVATLSREGTPLSAPRTVGQGNRLRVAANQSSALAFSATGFELSVQPLDLDGVPNGNPVAHVLPGPSHGADFMAAAPVPGGFALAIGGYGTTMMRFHADGTAMPGPPLLLDPAADGPPAIASNGTDTLVLLTATSADYRNELRSVVVSAAGVITDAHAIYNEGDWIASRGIVWDGTQYTAAIDVLWDSMRWIGKPALLHIDRHGQRTSDVHQIDLTSMHRLAYDIATNGHDLIVPAGPECVVANPVSLQTTALFPIGRTLNEHDLLRIGAGRDGYVAAWRQRSETSITIRATRISPWGDPQDGDGIVLQTPPADAGASVHIAVDAYGPRPLVVWSASGKIYGRFLPGTKTFAIGTGEEVDVRWDGTQFVVLFTDGSLRKTMVSPNGTVGASSVVIAEAADTTYLEPQLALVSGHLFAFAVKHVSTCGYGAPPGSCEHFDIIGRRLDGDGTPFVVALKTRAGLAVAESASQALVSWGHGVVRAAFVSGDGLVGTPFPIDLDVSQTVAFDGTNFVLAGLDAERRVTIARISPAGAVGPIETISLDDDETMQTPQVAASATFAPLILIQHHHPAYDWVARGSMFFLADRNAVTPPNAPTLLCATKNADNTITARWQRVNQVLGYSIELELSDGTFRPIGLASANATSARVSLAGLEGDAVRVRAWNAAGFSAGSSTASSVPMPAATLRASQRACANTPATITVFLAGTAPFTVQWADGVVQTNLQTSTATRTVQVAEDTTFTIVSVQDSSCGVNETPESIRIDVDPQPAIEDQTRALTVTANQAATLTVSASDASQYAWFEGARGDTSHPVGKSSATFTTPPLTRSTGYWVRVSNRCGNTDSDTINVSVSAKRRAARR